MPPGPRTTLARASRVSLTRKLTTVRELQAARQDSIDLYKTAYQISLCKILLQVPDRLLLQRHESFYSFL